MGEVSQLSGTAKDQLICWRAVKSVAPAKGATQDFIAEQRVHSGSPPLPTRGCLSCPRCAERPGPSCAGTACSGGRLLSEALAAGHHGRWRPWACRAVLQAKSWMLFLPHWASACFSLVFVVTGSLLLRTLCVATAGLELPSITYQAVEPAIWQQNRKAWVPFLSWACFAILGSSTSPCIAESWCRLKEGLAAERGAKAWSCCFAHLLLLEVYSLLMAVVAVAAQICSPAWVNETFFSKLLRFLIADCTRVTKLTQGSSMHAQ